MKIVKCDACGEIKEHKSLGFCDRCYDIQKYFLLNGVFESKKILKKCQYCNKDYYIYPHRIKKTRQFFCSKKCRNLGFVFTDKIRKKMSVTSKKIGKIPPYRLGAKMPQSFIHRVSGKNSIFWRGGKSFEPYPIEWKKQLKEQIRKRDNFKCQLCGVPQEECLYKLSIHHIDYNKNNLSSYNLISLCANCHAKTNNKRDYWMSFFKERRIYVE